jgi:hypothetical protein
MASCAVPITDDERDRLPTIYRERVDHLTGVRADYREKWLRWCRTLLGSGG